MDFMEEFYANLEGAILEQNLMLIKPKKDTLKEPNDEVTERQGFVTLEGMPINYLR